MSRINMPTAPALIDRLRALVDQSDRSHAQVARDAGLAPPNLSRILAGETDPRASTLQRLLTALGRRWADLD